VSLIKRQLDDFVSVGAEVCLPSSLGIGPPPRGEGCRCLGLGPPQLHSPTSSNRKDRLLLALKTAGSPGERFGQASVALLSAHLLSHCKDGSEWISCHTQKSQYCLLSSLFQLYSMGL
jgi:hypothetical protein